MATSTTTDATALRGLLHSWEKALRTLSIYLPNNPVREQTIEGIQQGLSGVWEQLPEFALAVSEAGLEWKSELVLPIENKSESLAWTLFRDGIRWIVFSPGAEGEEIITFLTLSQRARTLTDEDEDDLRTLLWSADLQFIRYKVAELGEIEGEPIEGTPAGERTPKLTKEELRALLLGDVEEGQEEAQEASQEDGQEASQEGGQADSQEAGPEGENGQGPQPVPKGVVNLAEYESTLYFLDDQEIDYLRDEVRREYEHNLNENVLSMLFDIFEEQPDAQARTEIISILGDLLPHLLNAGDFHSVACLISETQVVLGRVEDLAPEHRELLTVLTMTFSRPAAVEQLLEALEVATIEPSIDETEQVFNHMTPDVLSTVLKWHGRLSNEEVRQTLGRASDRMAEEKPAAVGVALGSSERVVVIEALRLVKDGGLEGVEEQLVGLVGHDDVGIRNALVRALVAVPTSPTMKALVRLMEDTDPEVRTNAARGLAMRRYKGALPVLERVVLDKQVRSRDLTERRAFFRAYGIIAGEAGVSTLREILLPKVFWRSVDADTRACAAMALGHVPSQSARGALQRASKARDLVVRSAAMRALRQDGS
jgi:hypothetical protein